MSSLGDSLLRRVRAFDPPGLSGRFHLESPDGPPVDAVFAYTAPDRWRVRYGTGLERIVAGPEWWERTAPGPWTHQVDERGVGPHHDGPLVGLVRPVTMGFLAPGGDVADVRTMPAEDELTRLRFRALAPEPVTVTLDVEIGGLVRRAEADGTVLSLTEVVHAVPDPALFAPETTWRPLT